MSYHMPDKTIRNSVLKMGCNWVKMKIKIGTC